MLTSFIACKSSSVSCYDFGDAQRTWDVKDRIERSPLIHDKDFCKP